MSTKTRELYSQTLSSSIPVTSDHINYESEDGYNFCPGHLSSYYYDCFAEKCINIGTFPFYQEAEVAVSKLQKEGFAIRKISIVTNDEDCKKLRGILIWKDTTKNRELADWLKGIVTGGVSSNIPQRLIHALTQLGVSVDRAVKYKMEIEAGKLAVFVTAMDEDINYLQHSFLVPSKLAAVSGYN